MKSNNKKQFGQTDIEGTIAGYVRMLDQLAQHPKHNLHLAPLSAAQAGTNIISGLFNRQGLYEAAMAAYIADLPLRQRLEGLLANLQHSQALAPELAAA